MTDRVLVVGGGAIGGVVAARLTLGGHDVTVLRDDAIRVPTVSQKGVLAMGLTLSMLEDLGEPDTTKQNPHHRSGPQLRLYSVQRVEDWIAAHRGDVEAVMARRRRGL